VVGNGLSNVSVDFAVEKRGLKRFSHAMKLRQFIRCGIVLLPGVVFSAGKITAAPASDQPSYVYFGTYTAAKSKGIYLSQFDAGTGKLSSPELVAETKNPSFLAISPNRRFLYAVSEISGSGGKNEGAVSAFTRDPKTGKLTFLNQQPSGGGGPCHVSLDRAGRFVLAANYGTGSIAALPVQMDGKLGPAAAVIQHTGSSINPQRQAGPHAHFITTDPTSQYVLACDLGLDKVLVYWFAPRSAEPLTANKPPSISIKPGSGPRHLAFHPDGRHIYLVNEMSSTLTSLSYNPDNGTLEEAQTLSTLPDKFEGHNSGAEVQVHPSGKFVYSSNRGHDSIAIFAVDPKTSRLKPVGHQSTQGKTPRHFALDPSGKWLVAENQDSNSVVVFAVDKASGKLTPTGQTVEVGSPVCAVFVGQ
jgi:6-phosphogluconolactonase